MLSDKYGGGCIACRHKWCMSCSYHPCNQNMLSECGDRRLYYSPRPFCPFCGKPLTTFGEETFIRRLKNIIGEECWPY